MPRMLIVQLQVLGMLLAWLLAAPSLAQAPCTRDEFLTIFQEAAERQLELDTALASLNDLLSFSESAVAERQSSLSALPNCADALAYQRLSIEVTGDFIARQALDLANVPRADNPYRQRYGGEFERIGAALSALLSLDRSQAPRADERSLPHCSDDELSELDELVGALLTLLDSSEASDDLAYTLLAIEARLLWRDDALQEHPACAEWVELLPMLSAAATDSATGYAIAAVSGSAHNLFSSLTAEHMARLQYWRSPDGAALSVPGGATIASSGLPACSAAELAQTRDLLLPDYNRPARNRRPNQRRQRPAALQRNLSAIPRHSASATPALRRGIRNRLGAARTAGRHRHRDGARPGRARG